MGKNSQNVIISIDGMRSVMNIIKKNIIKKKKKYKQTKKIQQRLQMVAINVLDVLNAARESHTSTSRIANNG